MKNPVQKLHSPQTKRSRSFTLALVLALLLSQGGLLFADQKGKGEEELVTDCRVDVEYKWKRKATSEGDDKVKAVEPGESHSVLFVTLEAKAPTEKEAKELLDLRVIDARQRAMKECKQKHESISFCVSSKYDTLQTVLSRLDFAARSTLQESVRQECEQQSGVCESISIEEPECFIPGPPLEEEKKGGAGK